VKLQLKEQRFDMNSNATHQHPVEIFVSYAHEDADLLQPLLKHLRLLERQGLISVWTDNKIEPGSEWRQDIGDHLRSAQIILLLISPDFMDSEFIWHTEMSHAVERHEAGTATVIPVILRECMWTTAPFGRLNALPRGGKALTQADDMDATLAGIAKELYDVILSARGG
jgi:hypothetical protein